MSDYGDLVRRLRGLYVQHGTNYVQQAADAIEALQRDAARYRWLRDARGLDLRVDGMKWTREDGSTFVSSHLLKANDTQYAALPTLDETIDAAMKDAP